MSVLPYVFHAAARPISVAEFADAVRATCPPRFPKARGIRPRHVGLAVSGGVDSMALAYLCAQLRREHPTIKISDNPVSTFRGIVVDHGLRAGSSEEARAVVAALQAMRIHSSVWTLNWGSEMLGGDGHPKDLPNLESAGRRLRYQRLGFVCSRDKMASLFLAHQEDDQYETVLMRLLQGHGSRGLRGMKKASDIPECEGIHGAYQSGYVDDQKQNYPFYSYSMRKRELKSLRQELRSSSSRQMPTEELLEVMARELERGSTAAESGDHDYGLEELGPLNPVKSLGGKNVEVEDGGVTVYRPFLEFSKDRLIATCLENKVTWWEDQTNHDASLTLRNAVRHLYKGHDLPKALQRPAILDLSRRCDRRAKAQEAAAHRLLSRAVIHEFAPNAGTAVVQFPHIKPPASKRETRSPQRRKARLSQQREIAGILIQKILALVSPEPQTPPLANLQNVIPRLFPSLASFSEAALATPAKAFNIAGVHLIPIESPKNPRPGEPSASAAAPRGQPLTSWYLSRTPYPSNLPLPRFRSPFSPIQSDESGDIQQSPWTKWLKWKLWDNRFWIRWTHRLPCRVFVQPFAKEHARPLRERLAPHDRARLAALLKRHAPGKVRYTLPAIYLERDLDLEDPYAGLSPDPAAPYPSGVPDIADMKLLALPTLGVRIPELDRWLEYQVRYRRVDRGTLETVGSFRRGPFVPAAAAKAKAKAKAKAGDSVPRQMGYGAKHRGRASAWRRGRQQTSSRAQQAL
ncbi:hypothetical protein SLS62_009272 [Diatrype stigma]|uniref:tRNA(Ile)-lysidine synthetase n=1 Tax=Diatrype stigma TaxID=117547 RepID=A0AAN9UFE5_9PEZI